METEGIFGYLFRAIVPRHQRCLPNRNRPTTSQEHIPAAIDRHPTTTLDKIKNRGIIMFSAVLVSALFTTLVTALAAGPGPSKSTTPPVLVFDDVGADPADDNIPSLVKRNASPTERGTTTTSAGASPTERGTGSSVMHLPRNGERGTTTFILAAHERRSRSPEKKFGFSSNYRSPAGAPDLPTCRSRLSLSELTLEFLDICQVLATNIEELQSQPGFLSAGMRPEPKLQKCLTVQMVSEMQREFRYVGWKIVKREAALATRVRSLETKINYVVRRTGVLVLSGNSAGACSYSGELASGRAGACSYSALGNWVRDLLANWFSANWGQDAEKTVHGANEDGTSDSQSTPDAQRIARQGSRCSSHSSSIFSAPVLSEFHDDLSSLPASFKAEVQSATPKKLSHLLETLRDTHARDCDRQKRWRHRAVEHGLLGQLLEQLRWTVNNGISGDMNISGMGMDSQPQIPNTESGISLVTLLLEGGDVADLVRRHNGLRITTKTAGA